MTIELERSYIFPYESVLYILDFLGARATGKIYHVVDDYLNPQLRIRQMSDESTKDFVVTRKIGDKSSGKRLEKEQIIDQETAAILTSDSKLRVVKERHKLFPVSPDFRITLDIIEIPMKIVVLEIESTNDQIPPTAKEIFDVDLQECPLAAWDFFRQKIGICGAPSSGKTETAKALSHLLNTRFHANSFNVLEYTTSFIQEHNRYPGVMDQFMLWHSQRAREESAASKADIVISDSPTFLAYIYMMFHHRGQMGDQFRIHLTKLYKGVLKDISGYSSIIYLQPRNLIKNNIRFHNTREIEEIAKRIRSFLLWHNIPHIVADCGDEHRILDSLFYMNETGKERQE